MNPIEYLNINRSVNHNTLESPILSSNRKISKSNNLKKIFKNSKSLPNNDTISVTTLSSVNESNTNEEGNLSSQKNEVNLILKACSVSSPKSAKMTWCQNETLISDQKKLINMLKKLNTNLEKHDLGEIVSAYKQDLKNQWTELAKVIDALMGYSFLLTSLLMLTYLFYKTPNAKFSL